MEKFSSIQETLRKPHFNEQRWPCIRVPQERQNIVPLFSTKSH